MFDLFSWSHIIILLTVALIVVGPKDLPRLMHVVGKWAAKARDLANEFKKSFDEMARQSELDELRAEVEKLRSHDPIAEFGNDVERALNPVDTATAEDRAVAKAAEPEAEAAPRAGEYQISETSAADSQTANPQTANPEIAAP